MAEDAPAMVIEGAPSVEPMDNPSPKVPFPMRATVLRGATMQLGKDAAQSFLHPDSDVEHCATKEDIDEIAHLTHESGQAMLREALNSYTQPGSSMSSKILAQQLARIAMNANPVLVYDASDRTTSGLAVAAKGLEKDQPPAVRAEALSTLEQCVRGAPRDDVADRALDLVAPAFDTDGNAQSLLAPAIKVVKAIVDIAPDLISPGQADAYAEAYKNAGNPKDKIEIGKVLIALGDKRADLACGSGVFADEIKVARQNAFQNEQGIAPPGTIDGSCEPVQ